MSRLFFVKPVDLNDRASMINFLNNHTKSKCHSDFPSFWTFSNDISIANTLPLPLHSLALDIIPGENVYGIINSLIVNFKNKTNFEFLSIKSDYNDNTLLLLPIVKIGNEFHTKISNFDTIDYSTCSDYFLRKRCNVLILFDELCDKIINEYYRIIGSYKKNISYSF